MSDVDLGEMRKLADGLRHSWNSNPAGRPGPLYMPHGGPLRAADVLEQAADELERLQAQPPPAKGHGPARLEKRHDLSWRVADPMGARKLTRLWDDARWHIVDAAGACVPECSHPDGDHGYARKRDALDAARLAVCRLDGLTL